MSNLSFPPAILPHGTVRCTACENAADLLHPRYSPFVPVPFRICGCASCGHIMRRTGDSSVRDLTRAEAAELQSSPDFPRIREVIEHAIRKLWG